MPIVVGLLGTLPSLGSPQLSSGRGTGLGRRRGERAGAVLRAPVSLS